MKVRIFSYLFIAGIVLIMLVSLTDEKEKFYYAFNEKILLFPKSKTLLVKYAKEIDRNKNENFLHE